jgi:hypothetical protein
MYSACKKHKESKKCIKILIDKLKGKMPLGQDNVKTDLNRLKHNGYFTSHLLWH